MRLFNGDCLEVLKTLPDNSVDSMVTDPPAGINLLNAAWDTDHNGDWVSWMTSVMKECLRVLKPGAHALIWALPRVSHKTGTALEDAGFEIRDVITHHYGTGFPKNLNLSIAIDKANGAERKVVDSYMVPDQTGGKRAARSAVADSLGITIDKFDRVEHSITEPCTDEAKKWNGWGTALKPSTEMYWLARKPCSEKNIAANVLKHGTGGINVDACRIPMNGEKNPSIARYNSAPQKGANGWSHVNRGGNFDAVTETSMNLGRYPTNLVISHSEDCKLVGASLECAEDCAVAELDKQSGVSGSGSGKAKISSGVKSGSGSWQQDTKGGIFKPGAVNAGVRDIGDRGGASRFFATFKRTECGSKNIKADDTSVGKSLAASGGLSTDICGNNTSDQFLLDTIYITRTATHSTMTFQILNALNQACICTVECEGALRPPMESSIESVSIVSSTEALITFDDGETQVIRGIVTTAPVESLQNGVSTTRNMEPNTCAAGEPKIETTAMRGRENISPKTESVSTLSAGPDIRRNRFFYCAKASKSDRNRGGADNKHPTVKSTQLMRYLVKLITPPGGIVLDPFTGSGSTGVAAKEEGMDFIGIEQQPEYCEIARTRIGILQIPEENTNADPG